LRRVEQAEAALQFLLQRRMIHRRRSSEGLAALLPDGLPAP
jgi:hypothetical protein